MRPRRFYPSGYRDIRDSHMTKEKVVEEDDVLEVFFSTFLCSYDYWRDWWEIQVINDCPRSWLFRSRIYSYTLVSSHRDNGLWVIAASIILQNLLLCTFFLMNIFYHSAFFFFNFFDHRLMILLVKLISLLSINLLHCRKYDCLTY